MHHLPHSEPIMMLIMTSQVLSAPFLSDFDADRLDADMQADGKRARAGLAAGCVEMKMAGGLAKDFRPFS